MDCSLVGTEESPNKEPKKAGDEDVGEDEPVIKHPALFSGVVDDPQEMLLSLPVPIRRRIQALKKLQMKGIEVESDFYKKVHQLECQFATEFQELYEQRREIASGKHEPTDEEAEFPLLHDMEHISAELKEKLQMQNGDPPDDPTPPGVPDFWLTVLKHHETACDMIQEQDEPILKHLTDITLDIFQEPMFFRLNFHFAPNEWFSNGVLIKEYTLKCDPDPTEPFEFEGPEIVACKGCKIDWKQGKDVTRKPQKKKVRNKHQKGKTQFVTKMVKTDSFFNFFDPPENKPDDDFANMEEDARELLSADFEIGQQFREHIVPRAVLYFTGEATLDDSFEDMDEDDDFDEDEQEDEEDEEGAQSKSAGKKEQSEECKQQ